MRDAFRNDAAFHFLERGAAEQVGLRLVATSSDRAYEALRKGILNGEFAMGSRLGEVELASQLGISRTPIREALHRLGADGLVELERNRGARVALWTDDDVDEIFVLRALLESHGASLAALAISDEQIAELDSLCDAMERAAENRGAGEVGELSESNNAFHGLILQASGSPRLPGLVSSVVQMPLAMRTFTRYSDTGMERSANHHRELVAALRARNPSWAAAVMHAHFMAARHELACWGDPAYYG